jgi:hypothetical protein
MQKLDLTKCYKAYYTAKKVPELLDIERAQFLSITGKGDPSGKEYHDKIQALYSAAYNIKTMCKAIGKDFTVAKLEGLWSFDENKYQNLSITESPAMVPPREWTYRIMIRMPEYVTQEQVSASIRSVVARKQLLLAEAIELFTLTEGKVVQMLHVGPFVTEPETLEQIQKFMQMNGLKKNGFHHEIYLSDFNKTSPDKLKTILREPVSQTGGSFQ